MDNVDNPSSRVQRTLWTVWCYIAEAVNRFFRPEPDSIVNNDPNSSQEPSVDIEPANSAHAEGEAPREGADEEQSLARASLLSSSRPVVAWELCTDVIDLGPDEESNAQPSTASEEGEGTREERFAQTGSDDTGLRGAKEDDRGKFEVQELYTRGRDEREEHANARSSRTADDKMNEDAERSGEKTSAGEENERAETSGDQKMDESMTTIIQEDDKMDHEDEQDMEAEDNDVKSGLVTDEEEAGNLHKEETKVQISEADIMVICEEVESSDKALQLIPDNENKSDEAETQVSACEEMSADDRDRKGAPSSFSLHVESEMSGNRSSIVSEDELSDAGEEHVMVHRSENDEEEDQSTSDERDRDSAPEEENVTEVAKKQATDAAAMQEENIKSVTEESQEKDISTGHIACNYEVVQNTEIVLVLTDEFTDGEQEDVAKAAGVQTENSEIDAVETQGHDVVVDANSEVTATDISTDERFCEKERREEKLSSEAGDEDVEAACTGPSLTVNPEGETAQEVSSEIKNDPRGICGGWVVMSQELSTPTCRETQGEVPEYNNEPGPDENTTRWFLEVGNCEETQTTQLPEEVESKESESFQNTGCSTGGDHLPVSELMEEEEKSTEDIKNNFDLVVEEPAVIFTEAAIPQETVKLFVESVIEESRLLLEEEEELSVDSMKTGVEHLEKDFEMHVGLTDELQDGAKELLIESGRDVGSCEFKEAEALGDCREASGTETAEEEIGFTDGQRTTETSFFQGPGDVMNSEQNSKRIPVLQDDITEPELLQKSVRTDREDRSLEMQDAEISGEEIEEDTAEDEMQSKNEMGVLDLQVKIAAEISTEWEAKENTLVTKSLETEIEETDEAFEISNKKTATVHESETPKDLVLVSREEMYELESVEIRPEEKVCSVSERRDVIEEEILDLWIQTALSEDTDGTKQQHGPEPGQEMGTEMESSNEEQVGFSLEQDEGHLMESREAELGSDTEMSSSTAESGFLDQSLVEWGTQKSETQLPKSTSAGSSHGIYDMLCDTTESADISELPAPRANSGDRDTLMLETAEMRQSHEKEEESVAETGIQCDSGVESPEVTHLYQEFEKPQEETEAETGSLKGFDAEVTHLLRKTEGKDIEEENDELLTEMSPVSKAEETKVDPLEMTESDSPDESRSGSESLLEEEIVPTESGSQDDICTEFELPSADEPENAESFPVLNQAEVAEEPTTEFEVEMEVDGSVLDFAIQKSRIAVKNPHVRPPKDPRSLLHKPSLDPTPTVPRKVPAGVPLGGLGIGIKLPGLGAGFPVLKKTQRMVKDEPETLSQEPETKPEEKSDSPRHDEIQHKPKWMPPRQPGFGNPLMSELKSKLKKTTKD